MPTSVRKSSIGTARRQAQKAHIPYRGDNPEVGKKTGVAVRHVERKSDGFEPFDELMEQADERTPPVLKVAKKKKQSLPAPQDDTDEYGEMSMELDSPRQYFANSRQPVTPTLPRNGSSSRSVARTSDIDFDHIPSPRLHSSQRRSTPGPSRLSNSFRAEENDEDSDDDDNDNGPNYDYGGDYDAQPGSSGERHSPEATSFREMDQDDDDEQSQHAQEPLPTPSPDKRSKGKGRAALSDVPEERDSEVEDEIAQELEDVEGQPYSDDEASVEEEPEPTPKRAKTIKIVDDPSKPPRQGKARVKKENRPHREGVRKSTREHIKPLEYWRGERKVYGRPDGSGLVLLPHVKEIIRMPKEEPEPLQKRKRSARARSKTVEEVRYEIIPVKNPEEGWDDDTETFIPVLQYGSTTDEVERCVAYLSRDLVSTKVMASGDWRFKKSLGDSDFIASGILELPPKGKKPSKQTKDNTYIFYIIQGAVRVRIRDSNLILATGASFLVPRGNSYYIENISERDAKLFFTQARKVVEDNPPPLAPPRRSSVGAAAQTDGRSSSAGSVATDTRAVSKAPAPLRRAMSLR